MKTAIQRWLHRRPRLDFLIVGAEKAGTTALFSYLREMPGLYIPINKELNFFDRDPRWRDGSDFSALHRWFLFAPSGARLGEATPTTLMNPHAFPRIFQYNPHMKIIALLRSPVRRAHSAWNYRRARFRDGRDFMTAIRVEVDSGGSLDVARENKYRYVSAGFYAAQLAALKEVFPAENVLLIKYEEFERSQLAWVRTVADFLGVSPPPAALQPRRVNVWRYRAPLSESEFHAVLPLYLADIERVEALTGWDCSDWREYKPRGVSVARAA